MKGTRYLWINNLTSKTTAEDIRSVFHSYGKIQDVRIHEKNNYLGAIVAFMDVTAATKAHEETNKLDGLPLYTEFCDSSGYPGLDQFGNCDNQTKSDCDKISNDLSSSALDSSKLSSDVESLSQPTTRNSSPRKVNETSSQRRSRSTSYSSVQSGISSRTSSKHEDRKQDYQSCSYKNHYKKEKREKYQSHGSANRSVSPKPHYYWPDHDISWNKNPPKGLKVTHLPQRSSDTAIRDGLFHEFKKHGKILSVIVEGRSHNRHAVITFKKTEEVKKAFEMSREKVFFAKPIMVEYHKGYEHEDPELCPPEELYDEYHPKATKTLFVGNLDIEMVSEDTLYEAFSKYGEIIDIDIKTQNNQANHCYSFIQYTDIRSVVRALQSDDTIRINGYAVKLGFGKSHATNCLWLSNLAPAVNNAYLTEELSQIARVDNVILDRITMKALVFFESTDSAQSVLLELKKQPLAGRKVQVDFASQECQSSFIDKMKQKFPNGASNHSIKRQISHKGSTQNSHSYKMLIHHPNFHPMGKRWIFPHRHRPINWQRNISYNEENISAQSSQRKRFYPKNHLMRKKYASSSMRHRPDRTDSPSESYDSSCEKDKHNMPKYSSYEYDDLEHKFGRKHRPSYLNDSLRDSEYNNYNNTHDIHYSKNKEISNLNSKSIDSHKRRSYSRTESVSSVSHENDCATNYSPDEHSKSVKYFTSSSTYGNSSDSHKLRGETTHTRQETSSDRYYANKTQPKSVEKSNGSLRDTSQQNQSLSILERERNMLLLELSKLEKSKSSNMETGDQMREPNNTKLKKPERSAIFDSSRRVTNLDAQHLKQQSNKPFENKESDDDHSLKISPDLVQRLLQKAKETTEVTSRDRFHLGKSMSYDESTRNLCGRQEDQEHLNKLGTVPTNIGDKKNFNNAQRSLSTIEDSHQSNDLSGSFLRDPRLNSQHYQNIHSSQPDNIAPSQNNCNPITGCEADILTQLIHEVVLKSQITDSSSSNHQQLDDPDKRGLINNYNAQQFSYKGNLPYPNKDLTLEERIKMLDAKISHSDPSRAAPYDYGKFKIRKKSDDVNNYYESLTQPSPNSFSFSESKSKTDTTEFVKQMLTHSNSAFACPNVTTESNSDLSDISHRNFNDSDQFSFKLQNRSFENPKTNEIKEKTLPSQSAFVVNSHKKSYSPPVRSILKKDSLPSNHPKVGKTKLISDNSDETKSTETPVLSSHAKYSAPQSPPRTPSDSVTPIMSPTVPSNCVTKPRSGCKKLSKRKSQDEMTHKQSKLSRKANSHEDFFGPTTFLYANKKALLKKKNEIGLAKDKPSDLEKTKKLSKSIQKVKSKRSKQLRKENHSKKLEIASNTQTEKISCPKKEEEEFASDDDHSSASNNPKSSRDDDNIDDMSYESMYDKIKRRKNKELEKSRAAASKGKNDFRFDSEEALSTDDTHNENQDATDISKKHRKGLKRRNKSSDIDQKMKSKKAMQSQTLKEKRKKKQSNSNRKRIQNVKKLLASRDRDECFTDQSQTSFNSPIPNFLSDDSKMTPSTERMENSDIESSTQNVKSSSQDLPELYSNESMKHTLSPIMADNSGNEVIEEEIIFDPIEETIDCEQHTILNAPILDKPHFESEVCLDTMHVASNCVVNFHNNDHTNKIETNVSDEVPSSSISEICTGSHDIQDEIDADIEREAFRRYKKLPISHDLTNYVSSSSLDNKVKYHKVESNLITNEARKISVESCNSAVLCNSIQNADCSETDQSILTVTDDAKSSTELSSSDVLNYENNVTLNSQSSECKLLENTSTYSAVSSVTVTCSSDSMDQVISDVSKGLFDANYYISQWGNQRSKTPSLSSINDETMPSEVCSRQMETRMVVGTPTHFIQSQPFFNYTVSSSNEKDLVVSSPNPKNKAIVIASATCAFTPIISSSSSNSILLKDNNSADFDAEKENAPQVCSSTSLCHSLNHAQQVTSSNQPIQIPYSNVSFPHSSDFKSEGGSAFKPFETVRPPVDDRHNYKQVIESLGEELKNSLSNCGEFPTIWKGNLVLKNDEVFIQMHFINGNSELAKTCLNISNQLHTPGNAQLLHCQALRIVQRMRLETIQLDGVERKMVNEQEFCACWAIASGSTTEKLFNMNSILKNNFIKYLSEKSAAGIINIVDPSNNQTVYIVHIFPPCEFSAKHLERKTPQLMRWINRHCVPYLYIAITTV